MIRGVVADRLLPVCFGEALAVVGVAVHLQAGDVPRVAEMVVARAGAVPTVVAVRVQVPPVEPLGGSSSGAAAGVGEVEEAAVGRLAAQADDPRCAGDERDAHAAPRP